VATGHWRLKTAHTLCVVQFLEWTRAVFRESNQDVNWSVLAMTVVCDVATAFLCIRRTTSRIPYQTAGLLRTFVRKVIRTNSIKVLRCFCWSWGKHPVDNQDSTLHCRLLACHSCSYTKFGPSATAELLSSAAHTSSPFPIAWHHSLAKPLYKVVQIWPGQTVTCLHTNRPGNIWTTLYFTNILLGRAGNVWEISRP
jgi:hypothetical protein